MVLLPKSISIGSTNAVYLETEVDGVYVTKGERLSFRRVPPPILAALEALVRVISERLARVLERQGCWCGIWRAAC